MKFRIRAGERAPALLLPSGEMKKNAAMLALFFLIAFVYFYKGFIGDMLPLGYDIYAYFYPMQSLVKEQYLHGTFPFWNNYMFSGFPLMASSQHAVFYPVTMLPLLLLPHHLAYNLDVVTHYALAAFFTFLYARKIGIGIFSAFIAGALFSFMGYLMPHLQHLSILHTAIWLPLILYFFEDFRVTGNIRSSLLAALAIALQLFAGGPQICFYSYMVLLIFIIYYALSPQCINRRRFLKLSVLAFLGGLVIASPQIYASLRLSSLSARHQITYSQFSSFAFPLKQVPAFLFPFLSAHPPEGYIGSLFVVLAIAALTGKQKKNIHIGFWSIIALLSLALALGDAIHLLNRILFYVPIYHSFRGASKHIFEFSLAMSLLAAFGISGIVEGLDARRYLSLVGILLLCCVLFSITAFIVFPHIRETRALRIAGFIAVTALCLAVVIFLALKNQHHGFFKYLVIAVALLEITSFRSVNWIKTSNVDNYAPEVIRHISSEGGRTAFFAPMVSTLAMPHGISIVGGYDPLILQDYNVMFLLAGIGSWPDAWPQLIQNNMILSMLNTRYVVLPLGRKISASSTRYREIFANDKCRIYQNNLAMPRAYPVTHLRAMKGINRIRTAIMTYRIDAKSEAIVSPGDLKKIGSADFSRGSVFMVKHTYDRVSLRTDFKGRGFVVLSDSYYPGWKALVDGVPTRIYRTDEIVRGIVVPGGVHRVIFEYRPVIVYLLMLVSAIVSCFTVLAIYRLRGTA